MRFKHSIISAVCEFCAHPLPSKHLMDFLRLNSGGTGSCLNLCVLVKGAVLRAAAWAPLDPLPHCPDLGAGKPA